MFKSIALTAAAGILSFAGFAQAQSPTHSCNIGSASTNYSCVIEEWMDSDGFTVNISNYAFPAGSGNAYVIETSNLNYNDWNDPYITDGSWNYLADAEYVNGHARFICASVSTCPSQIKVLPNWVTNKKVRVNIYRLNN